MTRRVAKDNEGRRWETQVSKIGPALAEETVGEDLAARWRAGAARFRVACHEADAITALAWHEETLCLGTRNGLVRTVDVESGSVVGDYYIADHMPLAPISHILFDGQVIIAADGRGRVCVWRGELPGSWGFSHSPSWVMRGLQGDEVGTAAHAGAIKGLALLSTVPDANDGGLLVSAAADGTVILWSPLGRESEVSPSHVEELPPVEAICTVDRGTAVLAATIQGLFRLECTADGRLKSSKLLEQDVWPPDECVTSMAWDQDSGALFFGLSNGWLQRWNMGSATAPVNVSQFHGGPLRSLSFQRHATPSGSGVLLSAGADGRLGVWDTSEGRPLWGLQGLSPASFAALGDRSRLIASGVVINKSGSAGTSRELNYNWVEPQNLVQNALPCEAVLCLDFLKKPESMQGQALREPFWPSVMQSPVATR